MTPQLDDSMAMQLDDSFECLHILKRHCADGTQDWAGPLPGALDWFATKYAFTPGERAELAPIGQVYRQVVENLRFDRAQLLPWFAPLPGLDDCTVGELALRTSERCRPGAEDWQYSLLLALVQGDLLDENTGQKLDQTGFLRKLAATDLPDETKWRLTDLALRLPEHRQQAQLYLDDALALFRQCKPALAPVLEQFGRPLLARLRQGGIGPALQELGLYHTDIGCCRLTFSVMAFNSASIQYLNSQTGDGGDTMQLHYGLLLHWIQQVKQRAINQDTLLLARLRAMADKNRLQILLALRQHTLCGQELANLLKLSPATISHHISELLQVDLVRMEKQGNTINYQLEPQGLDNLLEQLRSRLG